MISANLLVLGLTCSLAVVGSARGGEHHESVEEHLVGEHSQEYDHEAFLGKTEAEKFDQLPPEEAKRRLGIIVEKIDSDKDGYVTEKELEDWIRHVEQRYIMDDVMKRWEKYDANSDGGVTLTELKEARYGQYNDENELFDTRRNLTYKDMVQRDSRSFEAADLDGDKDLTIDQLADFLHPDDVPHMREIVLDQSMEDMDKNRNGFLSIDEYIDSFWPQRRRDNAKEESEWLQMERKRFSTQRDKDGDGQLSKAELEQWIMPENYDHAQAEAAHLMHEADVDNDKRLTKEEVLQHQDVFVGSQATEFGDYLVRHDEF